MKNPILSAVLGAALVCPTLISAQSVYLRELLIVPVRPIDANTFEVVENDGAGGTELWCAAGKFTRDSLGQRGGDIAVLQARGASAVFPGRKSVIFTTRPVDNGFNTTSQGVRQAGQTFSTTHANALCRSNPERIIRIRIVSS